MSTNTDPVVATISIGSDSIEAYRINGQHIRFSLNGSPLFTGSILLGSYAGAVGESAVRRFVEQVSS